MIIKVLKLHNSFVRSNYEINIDEKLKYIGKSNFFSPDTKFSVYDIYQTLVLKGVDIGFQRGLMNHKIMLSNNETYEFISNSFLEHSLYINTRTVSFYEQKGHYKGIFFEDRQIGLFTKNKKYSSKGNTYLIKLENDVIDHKLIIGCVLSYDMKNSSDSGSIKLYDPGNVSIEPIKVVDEEWEPNTNENIK